uniref:Putative secreted protein n=1 Tax=Anopheles darlingi TaxID=43151 RepID=A0A2M4DFY4_ANODA
MILPIASNVLLYSLAAPPMPEICMRVFTKSSGCTTHVAPMPERPPSRYCTYTGRFFSDISQFRHKRSLIGRCSIGGSSLADRSCFWGSGEQPPVDAALYWGGGN